MMGNGLTIEATCAACHQPRGWAVSAAMTWCELCGACFRCGVRDVAMSVTAHECGKAPVILATGPTHPGYVHSTNLRVEGREAPRPYLPWANAGGPNECRHGYAAGIPCPRCDATAEACARAAYDAYWGGIPRYRWDAPEGDYSVRPEVKEQFREVARAVLAAAGVTR